MDWGTVAVLAFFAGAAVLIIRRVSSVRRQLRDFAVSAGLSDIRAFSDTNEVHGSWGEFGVSVEWEKGSEPTSDMVVMTIRAGGRPRMTISRGGWPLLLSTLTAPPVEVRHPAARELVVRCEELAVVDELFWDEELVGLLRRNLIAPTDRLELSDRGLRVTRACIPEMRPVLEAEWALATRIVQRLRLSPLAEP